MTKLTAVVNFLLIALVSITNVSANTDAKDVAYSKAHFNATDYGINTYGEAIAYGRANPTRDGGSWAGWCVK